MGWFKKLTGVSSKKLTSSVGKILASPYTALGSLTSGSSSVSDWFKSGASNLFRGLLASVTSGAGTGALGESWDPAVSAPMSKATAISNATSSGGGFLSSLGNMLGASGINLGSIVQGAVGLGTDYLSQQQQLANQLKINDKTFAQNQLLQNQAYQQNLAMWSAQNEYNSPVAQMERLKAAGLNPNLVYGSGNVTGNTAGSAPQFTPAQHEAPQVSRLHNVMDTIMNYQQIQNQALQNDFTRLRIELAAAASARADKALAMQERFQSQRLNIMRKQLGYTGTRIYNMQHSYQSDLGKIIGDIFKFGENIPNVNDDLGILE